MCGFTTEYVPLGSDTLCLAPGLYLCAYRVLLPLLLLLLLCVLLCCCCCSSSAAVRDHVRTTKFVAGSLNVIPVFYLSSFEHDFFFRVPLGSNLSHFRPRFANILGIYGHARSQGGRQPAAANPPLYPV